jgi:replicative DNA helicase
VNNDAFHRVIGLLEPRHFFEPIHGELFDIASRLIREGKRATPVTLKTFVPNLNIAGLTPSQYLARLAAEATTVVNAADYAQHIRDLAVRRDLISVGEDMVNTAYESGVDLAPEEQIEQAERRLFELGRGTRQTMSRPASMVIDSVVNHFTRIMTGESQREILKTPFAGLNKLIGGFRRENLVVVAGRPGMGKSTLATSVAQWMARAGIGVLFKSLEMSDEDIGARLLADHTWGRDSGITADKIVRGDLTNEEAERLVLAAREYGDLPLTIDTAGYLTVSEIASRARAKKSALERRGQSLDLLVVDYLKFVRPTGNYRGQRHYEIGEITASLRLLAKELGVCVLLLAQLNRETEKRDEPRPRLSDLRESGDIEADADLVLLLYREAYYLENNPKVATDADLQRLLKDKRNSLEIIVAKNRMGQTGPVEVFCDPGSSAIRNAARARDSEAA